MKRLIILQIIGVSCIVVTAQSLNGGMYSKEWENERDAINNTVRSTTHLQTSSQYWWMNGGAHVYMETGRSQSSQTRTRTSSTRRTSTRKMTGTTSYSGYSGQEFLERLERYHEEQERKRREMQRQNAEDRRVGYERHFVKNAPKYAASARRDQYMSTTGAEKLDRSLKAENYYSLPQVSGYSSNEALMHLSQFGDLLYLGFSESLYDVENLGPTLLEMFKEEQLKNSIVAKLTDLGINYTPKTNDETMEGPQSNNEEVPENFESDENIEKPGLNYSTFEEYLAEYATNGLTNFNNEDMVKFNNMLDANKAIQRNKQ